MSIQTYAASMSQRQHIQVDSSNSSDQQIIIWEELNAKQINLVVRFATRWKSVIEMKRWAKYWGISTTNCK